MGFSMNWATAWEEPVLATQWLFQPVTAGIHNTTRVYIYLKGSERGREKGLGDV